MARKTFRSWSTAVKLTWNVPRNTHTYIVDQLLDCGLSSLKTDTLARYGRFVSKLAESPSTEVCVMSNIVTRDIRSSTGENIAYLRRQTDLDPSESSVKLKKSLMMKLKSVCSSQNQWRIEYLGKLLADRGESHYNGEDEDTEYLSLLINSICTT